jgi:hypothetical protein
LRASGRLATNLTGSMHHPLPVLQGSASHDTLTSPALGPMPSCHCPLQACMQRNPRAQLNAPSIVSLCSINAHQSYPCAHLCPVSCATSMLPANQCPVLRSSMRHTVCPITRPLCVCASRLAAPPSSRTGPARCPTTARRWPQQLCGQRAKGAPCKASWAQPCPG